MFAQRRNVVSECWYAFLYLGNAESSATVLPALVRPRTPERAAYEAAGSIHVALHVSFRLYVSSPLEIPWGQCYSRLCLCLRQVVHFYRPSNRTCEVVDARLSELAVRHMDIRCVKINAEKSPFLSESEARPADTSTEDCSKYPGPLATGSAVSLRVEKYRHVKGHSCSCSVHR